MYEVIVPLTPSQLAIAIDDEDYYRRHPEGPPPTPDPEEEIGDFEQESCRCDSCSTLPDSPACSECCDIPF